MQAADFALFARAIMLSEGDRFNAVRQAEATPNASPRVAAVLRAAVSAGTTNDPSWASALADYQVIETTFVESLRSVGVFDRLLASGIRRVPLRSGVVASSTAVVGAVTGESEPKVVSRMSLVASDLQAQKVASIVVLSDNVVKTSTPAGLAFIGNELRRAVVAGTDNAFLTTLAHGETPIPATGSDAAAVGVDIRKLLEAVGTSADSALYLVAPPLIAKRLAGMTGTDGSFVFDVTPSGGNLAGMPLLVSDQIANDQIMLLDAAQVVGDAETITLDYAAEAGLVMDSAPIPGAGTITSFWQNNLVGVRAERWVGFATTGPNAVALLNGVTWGAP